MVETGPTDQVYGAPQHPYPRQLVSAIPTLRRALAPERPDRDDKLAIAVAFHDLAAFDTLDYLVPSIEAFRIGNWRSASTRHGRDSKQRVCMRWP